MIITVKCLRLKWPCDASFKFLLLGGGNGTIAEEAVHLIELDALFSAATASSHALLDGETAARETLPTLRYVTFNRNLCLI